MNCRAKAIICCHFLAFPWLVSVSHAQDALRLASPASSTHSNEDQQGPMVTTTEENDFFATPFHHTDRHYTQGLKFTYQQGDDDVPRWTKGLSDDFPAMGFKPQTLRLGFVFGQNIYTPQDLQQRAVVTNDRPYGGWLYTGMYLQREGTTYGWDIPVMETFEVDGGVTGPPSLGEATQVTFHHAFFPRSIPNGWHNQIDTEPGMLLKYQRLWRLSTGEEAAHYIDLIPHIGGEVGNIMIFGNIGAALRAGVNLPDDYGIQIIDSPVSANGGISPASKPFSMYVFGSVDGRAVGQNVFLDGSTLRQSPSVDRIPLVADLISGIAIRLFTHVEISYVRVVRTHEFVGQRDADVFGSLEAKAMFHF
jgi:lipid A 3-O-deacylase